MKADKVRFEYGAWYVQAVLRFDCDASDVWEYGVFSERKWTEEDELLDGIATTRRPSVELANYMVDCVIQGKRLVYSVC